MSLGPMARQGSLLDASRRRRASGTTAQLKLYGMKAAYDEIIAVVPKARLHHRRRAEGTPPA
ncbi:MAG: hypothetical protein V2I43_19465 [Parvularcula sp.]|jgi:hypothetical protein|nr:hypothetical protein [Parvularcula sp.]